MRAAVVDTDVVSFAFKGDSRASLDDPHLAGRLVIVSFMTVAELDLWARERHGGQPRKTRMEQHLRRYLGYPYDRSLCLKWAEATYSARRNERPIQTADAWIAATALLIGAPVATHNPGDYAGVDGLTVTSAATP